MGRLIVPSSSFIYRIFFVYSQIHYVESNDLAVLIGQKLSNSSNLSCGSTNSRPNPLGWIMSPNESNSLSGSLGGRCMCVCLYGESCMAALLLFLESLSWLASGV